MIPLSFSPTLPQSVSGNGSTSTADKTPSRRTSSNSHSLSMTDLTKKIDQLTMVTNKHLHLTHCPSSQSWAHGCRRKTEFFLQYSTCLYIHVLSLSVSLPLSLSLSLSFSLQEKTKAEDEANRHKKDLQKFSEKLDKSNFDLKRAEEMKSSLKEQFQHVEGHRDRLLDKVGIAIA